MYRLSFEISEQHYQHFNKCKQYLDYNDEQLLRAALEEYMEDIQDVIEAQEIQLHYTQDELIDFEDIKKMHNLE